MTDIYIIECTVNNIDYEGSPETYVETEFGYFTDEDKAEVIAVKATENENNDKFLAYLREVKKINEANKDRYEADLKIYTLLKESGVKGERLERFEAREPSTYKAYRFDEWVKMHGVEFSVTRVSKHEEK